MNEQHSNFDHVEQSRSAHQAAALKSIRSTGAKGWVPTGVAIAVAGVSRYGALTLIAPKIRQQTYEQALSRYQSTEAATEAQAIFIARSVTELQNQLNRELSSIKNLANPSPPPLNPGASTGGSTSAGSVAKLPAINVPTISAPTTHATTGASTTAG